MIEVLKPRSYVGSLYEGLKMPLLHFGKMFRLLWPVVLLVCWVNVVVHGVEYEVLSGAAAAQVLDKADVVWLCVFEVVALLAATLLMAHVVFQQRGVVTAGVVPDLSLRKSWRQVVALFPRSLVSLLIVLLLVGGMVASITLGFHFPLENATPDETVSEMGTAQSAPALVIGGEETPAPHSPLAIALGLGGGVVFLAMLLVMVPVLMQFLLTQDGLGASFRAFRWRNMGRTLAVLFLSGLLALAIVAIGALPDVLITYTDVQVVMARQQGDLLRLPAIFPALRVIGVLFSSCFAIYAFLFVAWPLLFEWGGTQSQKDKEDAMEKAEETEF